MRTRSTLALVLLAGACARAPLRPAAPGDLLTLEGLVAGAPLGLGAAELARLPRRSLRGVDPRVGVPARFTGPRLAALLGEEVEPGAEADGVVFHGADGYRLAVPVALLRQLQPVLADEVDGRPVESWSAGAGPLLLAWPDAEALGPASDPRAPWWWVRGVRRIELVRWSEVDGKALRVPAGATDEARRGAEAFGARCLPCHRIRGTGGAVGPELAKRLAVAGEPDRLAEKLTGHLARKSGLPAAADPPPGEARLIAAFLRAVAAADAP